MRLRRAASKRAACANCCVNVRAMKVRRRSPPEWVVPADSAYVPWLKRLRQTADRHQAKTSRDPNEVALVVAKALEAKRPRFRYQVGFFAKLDYFLRGKMPTRLICRGTTRYLGLPLAR